MNPENITPQQMAERWLKLLQENANPEKAKGAQKYFKEEVKSLGLAAPAMREMAKKAYQTIRTSWGVQEAIDFCAIMLANPYLEAKGLGTLVLEEFKKDYPKSLFSAIKGWLASNYCNNWASVDVLCPTSVGVLLQKYPDLLEKIKTWTGSPNRWVRRASIVSFIKLAKKPEYSEIIYKIARAHFADSDDLIQKANGWLLREAGKADSKRLEKFLLKHGSAIPRTTLRYAIERFDEKKRRALLAATR